MRAPNITNNQRGTDKEFDILEEVERLYPPMHLCPLPVNYNVDLGDMNMGDTYSVHLDSARYLIHPIFNHK